MLSCHVYIISLRNSARRARCEAFVQKPIL
ncbi:hypothetical protein ACFOPX_03775, partial [Helicobacter baculiformis]